MSTQEDGLTDPVPGRMTERQFHIIVALFFSPVLLAFWLMAALIVNGGQAW